MFDRFHIPKTVEASSSLAAPLYNLADSVHGNEGTDCLLVDNVAGRQAIFSHTVLPMYLDPGV